MPENRYLMESEDESMRLDLKTDPSVVQRQARWAKIRPGMRIGDFGCGPGKTSYYLSRLVQPEGSVLGIDISPKRIDYARTHYQAARVDFAVGDIREPLDQFGTFDFIWVRFVLEHYRADSFQIVKTICSVLKPGGIVCLIDLDYNCLTHYGLSEALEAALRGVLLRLERNANFDPYAGRKLYSYLYDLGFTQIRLDLSAHHLVYGPIRKPDLFNWNKKVEIAAKHSGYEFKEFNNGFEGFHSEFHSFFCNPRRFTYTPIICCRGIKPADPELLKVDAGACI
jgi:SAM-dependent methyltransferase